MGKAEKRPRRVDLPDSLPDSWKGRPDEEELNRGREIPLYMSPWPGYGWHVTQWAFDSAQVTARGPDLPSAIRRAADKLEAIAAGSQSSAVLALDVSAELLGRETKIWMRGRPATVERVRR